MTIIEAAVRRIVASALVAVGVFVAGCYAYWHLGAAALPALDLPTIVVTGILPGASPETMASTVATPLERRLGRLAGVTEISSISNYSFTQITIQFAATRSIEGAATDVEAAINAAGSELPADMPSRPTYKRVNPAMAPVILIAMTSATLPLGSIYDFADSIVRPKLAEVEGVANVLLFGAAKSSVRIRVNAEALGSTGLSLDDVRAAIVRTSLRRPLGSLDGGQRWTAVAANDQLTKAADYRPLVIANRGGAVVRLSDVATVVDDVANNRVDGRYNGRPALFALIQRKDGANIVDTIRRVRAELPNIRHWMPPSIDMEVIIDRAEEIEATLIDAKRMFALTAGLVVALVLIFLGSVRAMLISVVSIPISFAGTFVVMRVVGYSLDTISLLGLTLAVAFVVDDAIVMVENIVRLQHGGYRMMTAALTGARQITFTIVSITLSLVAAFGPFFLISGIIGALFREFAVTLCTAIVISAIVSLTLTPALCARFLHRRVEGPLRFLDQFSEQLSAVLNAGYLRALQGALRHQQAVLVLTIIIATLTIVLFGTVRRGFLPIQESGVIAGVIEGAPDTSFAAMRDQQQEISARILSDPAVLSISSMVGSPDGSTSPRTGRFFVALRPYGTRDNVRIVIDRLRRALGELAGSNVYMVPIEDINVGGRRAKGQYQFTLLGDNGAELERAAAVVVDHLTTLPELKDVGSDHEGRGLQIGLDIDRDKAGRIGLSPLDVDQALYNAFGQRQIATIYGDSDQYQVVLEGNAIDRLETEALQHLYLRTPDGSQVALRSIATMGADISPLTVTHQGEFPAITVTFNLAPGVVLGQAVERIKSAVSKLGLPSTIRGSFEGQARVFSSFSGLEPYLLLGALFMVYAVLGILYESYVHPLTILSTLPSAGFGALVALWVSGIDLSVVAFIGIILLVGIVKKNAILVIDFALKAERAEGLSAEAAIVHACALRFRPILMTNCIAILGTLPLILGTGPGANLRQPLGVAIIGGLIVSQAVTLFSTPVVYLYLDRANQRLVAWAARWWDDRSSGDQLSGH